MKKLLVFSIISIVLTPVFAFAITAGKIPSAGELGIEGAATNVKSTGDILNLIGDAVGYVYIVFFIIAALFVIFAAFNYLSGANTPDKIKAAHSQLIYAGIAIAVALLAVMAQVIIGNFLKGNTSARQSQSGYQLNTPASPFNQGGSTMYQ